MGGCASRPKTSDDLSSKPPKRRRTNPTATMTPNVNVNVVEPAKRQAPPPQHSAPVTLSSSSSDNDNGVAEKSGVKEEGNEVLIHNDGKKSQEKASLVDLHQPQQPPELKQADAHAQDAKTVEADGAADSVEAPLETQHDKPAPSPTSTHSPSSIPPPPQVAERAEDTVEANTEAMDSYSAANSETNGDTENKVEVILPSLKPKATMEPEKEVHKDVTAADYDNVVAKEEDVVAESSNKVESVVTRPEDTCNAAHSETNGDTGKVEVKLAPLQSKVTMEAEKEVPKDVTAADHDNNVTKEEDVVAEISNKVESVVTRPEEMIIKLEEKAKEVQAVVAEPAQQKVDEEHKDQQQAAEVMQPKAKAAEVEEN